MLGDSTHRGRFDAHIRGQLAPMVGREQEQALLLQRWTEASAGEGQAFVLRGDAGIGKSRLVRALRDAISGSIIPRSFCNALLYTEIRRCGQCSSV